MNEIIPQEAVESRIYIIRGQKVMLDADLADLYGVETKLFNACVSESDHVRLHSSINHFANQKLSHP